MRNRIVIIVFCILITACGGGGDSGNDIIVSQDNIDVTPNLSLLGDGQETELQIRATCNWTISVSENWLSVTPTSGSMTQTVKVSAGKNSSGYERTATLQVKGGSAPTRTVKVTQAKGSELPALSTNTSSLEFEAEHDSKSFVIYSNVKWTISRPDWCVLSETTGIGNKSITVTVNENPNEEKRSGQIVVSGEGVNDVTIAVSQKAKDITNTQIPDPGDNTPPTE